MFAGSSKSNTRRRRLDQLASAIAERHLYAVFEQVVLFLVNLQRRLRQRVVGNLANGVLIRGLRKVGIQLDQRLAKIAGQSNFAIILASQRALRTEGLVVVGIDTFPAEFVAQIVGGGLLDEGVFGVAWHLFTTFLC